VLLECGWVWPMSVDCGVGGKPSPAGSEGL
jgi:hypothetical protein